METYFKWSLTAIAAVLVLDIVFAITRYDIPMWFIYTALALWFNGVVCGMLLVFTAKRV